VNAPKSGKGDGDAASRRRAERDAAIEYAAGRPLDEAWISLALPPGRGVALIARRPLSLLPVVNPMLWHWTGSTRPRWRGRDGSIATGAQAGILGRRGIVDLFRGRFIETLVGAKMTIPWGNRARSYQANIDRARQEQSAVEREFAALERRLRGEAIAAHTDAENAARQAAAFTDEVIPRLEKAVAGHGGRLDKFQNTLLEVLEARRALLNARLEQRRFIACAAGPHSNFSAP